MDGKQFQRTEDGHLILMSADERDLLITDLTARIKYGVICLIERVDDFGPRFRDEKLTGFCYDEIGYFYFQFGGGLDVEFAEKVKPYLRSMSSMTEEEKIELCTVSYAPDEMKTIEEKLHVIQTNAENAADFYNAHHFDYRGLIEKGLALEAPEEMYKTN